MSYTPTEWTTGDVITAEKLNKIENGIVSGGLPSVTSTDNGDVLTVVNGAWAKAALSGGGALIVHATEEETDDYFKITLDKTAREIISSMPLVYIPHEMESSGTGGKVTTHSHLWLTPNVGNAIGYLETEDGYVFDIFATDFIAATLDDYPSAIMVKDS